MRPESRLLLSFLAIPLILAAGMASAYEYVEDTWTQETADDHGILGTHPIFMTWFSVLSVVAVAKEPGFPLSRK